MDMEFIYTGYKRDWDYIQSVQIIADEMRLSFHDGEIEDNSLGRNFSDVYNIEGLVKLAYEVGKRGDDLNIIVTEIDDEDKAR